MVSHTVEAIRRNLKRGVAVVTNRVADGVEERLKRMERLIAMKMSGMVVLLVGSVFLSLAAYFFLDENLQLGNALSFLIVGAILLIIGFFLRSNERRLREYER